MSNQAQIDWLKSLPSYTMMTFKLGRYNDNVKYVGATGDWKSKIIPRSFYGVDVNVCAFIHDYHYSFPEGNEEDRFNADAGFLANMMRQIELTPDKWWCYGANWLRRHNARLRAVKYFEAVRYAGKKSFYN